MKKTYTINISGTVFHIEEDAYEVLQKYMENLKNHFGNSEEGKEIVSDIEARIAEIFAEKSTGKETIISLEMVNKLVDTMGTPDSFIAEEEVEEPLTGQSKRKRKLYRDPEQTVLAGVCGGLAVYFNADPVIVRLITVVLVLITSGAGLLAYLILWIIIPKAVTTTQRLEMMGEEVTVKNIEKFIKDELNAVKKSYNKFRKSRFFSRS
jgi:phage shock protein PspC (stress-responsive transcriptional regulator)